jgi:hypothetical protein
MLHTPSQGIKLHIHELIKYILETKDNSVNKIFYDAGLQLISDFLETEYRPDDTDFNNNIDLAKSLCLDIISKSVVEDNYSIKNYLTKYNLLVNIKNMYRFNSKLLNIAIIKFYKCLVASGFKPYITEIIKYDLLDVVIDIYDKLANKRNMIGSIILELFRIITRDGISNLARHLWERHETIRPHVEA